MKDTYYFSHDFNTRSDEKIKKLIRKHGYLGYGLFWAIVEELYQNANALQTDYDGIAFDLHSDKKTIESIIKDFDLFEINDGVFGSLSVERRLNERAGKSESARKSANYRWSKLKEDANAMRTQCDGNAIKERKGKEKKGKEKKGNELQPKKSFIPPLIDEVVLFFYENGYTEESAKKYFQYYHVNNWHDAQGTKVKSWKQKAISVWFKPENKKPEVKQPVFVA